MMQCNYFSRSPFFNYILNSHYTGRLHPSGPLIKASSPIQKKKPKPQQHHPPESPF